MLSLLRPKRNKKTTKNDNPFDDISFWFSIATINFGFCETKKETEIEPNKQQEVKHWKMRKHYITESYGGFYGNT
jgi:hypothetical protein